MTCLAIKRKVSASSQNQAFNALLFLFRHVLKIEFGEIKDIPRAKRRPYIPTVLSRDEVDAIITRLRYPYDLVVKLLYGCGLRISECVRLRVQDLNFDHRILTVSFNIYEFVLVLELTLLPHLLLVNLLV